LYAQFEIIQPYMRLSFCRNTPAKARDGLPHRLGPVPFSKAEKMQEEALYIVFLARRHLPRILRAGRAGELQNRALSVLAARDATELVVTKQNDTGGKKT
jgi:hypothetical protein